MRELWYIAITIWHARRLQTFLWGRPGEPKTGSNDNWNDWMRNMEYRLKRLKVVDKSNPSWSVEGRKRALQLAGVAIAFITAINRGAVEPEKRL